MKLYDRIFAVIYQDTLITNKYFIPLELTIVHLSVLLSFYINVLLYLIFRNIDLILNVYTIVFSIIINFIYFRFNSRYLKIIDLYPSNRSNVFSIVTKIMFYISYFIPVIMYIVTY